MRKKFERHETPGGIPHNTKKRLKFANPLDLGLTICLTPLCGQLLIKILR